MAILKVIFIENAAIDLFFFNFLGAWSKMTTFQHIKELEMVYF